VAADTGYSGRLQEKGPELVSPVQIGGKKDFVQLQGLANQIVGLNNYQFVSLHVSRTVPVISGVIECHSKVGKLGNEPPPGAVIAESIRRYSPNPAKVEADTLEFPAS
jgi:hypothetical protein